MPKVVDHEARRRGIVEALFRVAERGGLAAATYRTIASEAGVPAPQVQYYFATKGAMLAAAMQELGVRIVGRGMQLIAALGPDPASAALLRAAIEGAHPGDQERRRDLVLFYQFLVAGLADDALGESGIAAGQGLIIDSFADIIRTAQQRGEVDPGRDPVHEARLVLFGNTGLVLAALLGIHSVDDAKAAIDYHLDKLFAPARARRGAASPRGTGRRRR